MLVSVGLLILSIVLLFLGAEFLVKGSSAIALKAGISPLVVGLTVVAFGTSMPELLVSIQASWQGSGGMAVGNVVGSNIFNICVILGISAMINPLSIQLQVIKFDTPVLLMVTILFIVVFIDQTIGRLEGIILLAGIISYTFFNIRQARLENVTPAGAFEIPKTDEKGLPVWKIVLLVSGGLVILGAGSQFLVRGASDIARSLNVDEAIIGLTIIAAGTSMPELATSVVASLRKNADISIGNIIGSNIFNLLGIIGVTGTINPIQASNISWIDIGVMFFAAVVLLPLMKSDKAITKYEGFFLLLVYAGYLYYLWPA